MNPRQAYLDLTTNRSCRMAHSGNLRRACLLQMKEKMSKWRQLAAVVEGKGCVTG